MFRSRVRRGFTVEVVVWTMGFEGWIEAQQAVRTPAHVETHSYGSSWYLGGINFSMSLEVVKRLSSWVKVVDDEVRTEFLESTWP